MMIFNENVPCIPREDNTQRSHINQLKTADEFINQSNVCRSQMRKNPQHQQMRFSSSHAPHCHPTLNCAAAPPSSRIQACNGVHIYIYIHIDIFKA